jgi:hypothetical protein
MSRPRRIVGACLIGAYLVVVGFFGGVIVSAMRFDAQRAAVLSKLEVTSARVHDQLMRFERDAAGVERAGGAK